MKDLMHPFKIVFNSQSESPEGPLLFHAVSLVIGIPRPIQRSPDSRVIRRFQSVELMLTWSKRNSFWRAASTSGRKGRWLQA